MLQLYIFVNNIILFIAKNRNYLFVWQVGRSLDWGNSMCDKLRKSDDNTLRRSTKSSGAVAVKGYKAILQSRT